MKKNLWRVLAAVATLAFFQGCSGSGGSNSDVSTFEATVAGAARQSGKLSVTIEGRIARAARVAGSDTLAASGTLTLVGGGVMSLTGAYSPSTGELTLSGGGYSFTGTINAGELNGTFTAVGKGGGIFTGADSNSGEVAVYCGTYSGTRFGTGAKDGPMEGVFNMVISSDGSITGIGMDDLGVSSHFKGKLNGNSISLVTDGGTTITGSRNGNTVSGTFSESQSSGTWSGTRM